MIDSKQLTRHFSYGELAQLYEFDFDEDCGPIDQSNVDRIDDRILQNLIKANPDTIVSYCEHDSFLVHRHEETLTAEEQQEAADEGFSYSGNFLFINFFLCRHDEFETETIRIIFIKVTINL